MCNYRQLNTGVGVMCGWCLACRTGVVLNTAKRRLTQTAVFFRRHFLCGALLCNCSSAKREGLSTHVQRECSAEPFMRSSILSHQESSHLSPVLAYDFFIAMQIKFYFNIIAHLCTAVLINRCYACAELSCVRNCS